MARGKQNVPEPPTPSVPPERGIELIQKQIDKAKELDAGGDIAAGLAIWGAETREVLAQAFGNGAPQIGNFLNTASFSLEPDPDPFGRFSDPSARKAMIRQNEPKRQLDCYLMALKGFIGVLKVRIDARGESQMPTEVVKHAPLGSKVFIVHGRSDRRHEVARFITKLKLEHVILDEQPDMGRVLIQKFEDHATETGFAVVLLTADDRGQLATELDKLHTSDEKVKALRPRARENALFELGYFRGQLGARRVCALHEEGIELPSDLAGVLTVPLNGEWKVKLARELKAAHLPIDASGVLD